MVTTQFDKPGIAAFTTDPACEGHPISSLDAPRVRAGAGRLLAVVTVSCALLFSAVGMANAEDRTPDATSPVAGPVAKEGIRVADPGITNAGPSSIRVADAGAPLLPVGGVVRDSLRAVPGITGGSGTFKPGPFRGKNAPLGKW